MVQNEMKFMCPYKALKGVGLQSNVVKLKFFSFLDFSVIIRLFLYIVFLNNLR